MWGRRIFQAVFQRPGACPCRQASGQSTAVVPEHKEYKMLDVREDLNSIETPGLFLKPAFNLAAYVNKSETLQQLVKLGVNLHKLEKKPDLAEFVLGLDFERQIQPHLLFLHDLGIPSEELGLWLTKNPAILKENLEDLQVRITYLRSKRFKELQIQRIIQKNPFWLMFSTPKIDSRLGMFQKQFSLTGAETRLLAVAHPRAITYNIEHIRKAAFTVFEEMGMTKLETKELILKMPKILTLDTEKTIEKFDYLHNKMNIDHKHIVEDPFVLLSRQHRLEQRHKFLKHLGKAQYDRSKPMYVSLTTLVSGSDEEFVMNVAKSTLPVYETFLKTL